MFEKYRQLSYILQVIHNILLFSVQSNSLQNIFFPESQPFDVKENALFQCSRYFQILQKFGEAEHEPGYTFISINTDITICLYG